jgi:hypothetical protein
MVYAFHRKPRRNRITRRDVRSIDRVVAAPKASNIEVRQPRPQQDRIERTAALPHLRRFVDVGHLVPPDPSLPDPR